MRNFMGFVACLFLAISPVFAQTTKPSAPIAVAKSVSPITQSTNQPITSQTRAVVIGISDYRDPLIPDLRFADRDAEAFANWLHSAEGCALPDSSIRLLTNAQATTAQMIMAMDWLIEVSKPGDRAFIYFSGHGDVERVTKFGLGFLLSYDSPPAVYGAGAFSLQYLQAILSTLSENEVQVFMLTDACHAGKLAGSKINGTQATATQLSQQFANEIKVLSCQPDEFSLEGEQWGGGRGCFSYHLEDALYGFADQNSDATVDLQELRRYLEDHVSTEAAPQTQIPMVSGPMKTKVAAVRAAEVTARKNAKGKSITPFLAIDNKGMEANQFAQLDSSIRQLYAQFLAAVDSGQLMSPAGRSANDYYIQLVDRPEMEALKGSLKRTLAAALMDEGQRIINKVMQTDQQQLDNIWGKKVNYDHLPAYYHRAGEILGDKHYAYCDLKAKEFYFQSLTIRKENYPDSSAEWINLEKKRLLEDALKMDSTSALLFEALGGLSPKMRLYYFQKAVELAPNWALIYFNLGVASTDPNAAIRYYKKAMELDSNYLSPYNWISWEYENVYQPDSAKFYRRLYVEKFNQKYQKDSASITAFECNNVSNALWRLKDYEKAKSFWFLSDKIAKGKYGGYGNLIVVYVDLLEFENAIQACEKSGTLWQHNIYFNFLYDNTNAIEAYSKSKQVDVRQLQAWYLMDMPKAFGLAKAQAQKYVEFAFYAGEAAQKLGMPDTAAYYFDLTIKTAKIEFNRNNSARPAFLFAALANDRLGKTEAARQLLEQAKTALAGDPWLHFDLARFYANTQQPDAAIQSLYKAIELGWQPNPLLWLQGTLCDHLLNPIRETDAYKALIKKHFPQYYDIATRVPGK